MTPASHDREFPRSPRADYAPRGASSSAGWFATLKRTVKGVQRGPHD